MRVADYPLADAEKWAGVDAYFSALLAPDDDVLQAALAANAAAGLPAHDVSATQGKMLALFTRMLRAARILEIGTLGGYSTIWMARALQPDGRITTLEANPQHAQVASSNIANAGLSGCVDIHIGAALAILPTLTGPFDLIFIDADKKNNPQYLQAAISLSRPGTVIIADNIVRGGAVIDAQSEDANVQGVRECLQMLADHPQLDATALQTVGEKGWDGFAMAVVNAA
ncbi:O-methyltransferase [Serratia odorifera]|nr:O-methyltransferase [Serratia odorifera]PNK89398.1 O-methyltransferase [Serratia odorifera]RII70357.1 O-methyltransferase [Serratia odorifera]VDZ63433.1 Putative O-methyltransferase MSMEG_5073 [Serratia odorifera]